MVYSCSLNYAGFTEIFEIVLLPFYLLHNIFSSPSLKGIFPLCCLAFFLPFLCSVFKVQIQAEAYGGDNRNRTDDPLLAKQVLSQLSYTPVSHE